ncbi:MAG: DUF433 domain-containing protein [Asgard group archaeon]|nr:DUF433 domain-containing protein [Asgard group archaeon]
MASERLFTIEEGESIDSILENFSSLTKEDVFQVLKKHL